VAIRFGLRPTEANGERFDRWAFSDLDNSPLPNSEGRDHRASHPTPLF